MILHLHLFQDLKKSDLMGKADPYVQVHLLPGSHEVCKTKVVKNNIKNPGWSETFTFPVSVTDIVSKTVVLQVVDKDTLSKDDPMGEVQIPLWEMDLYSANDNVSNSPSFLLFTVFIFSCSGQNFTKLRGPSASLCCSDTPSLSLLLHPSQGRAS